MSAGIPFDVPVDSAGDAAVAPDPQALLQAFAAGSRLAAAAPLHLVVGVGAAVDGWVSIADDPDADIRIDPGLGLALPSRTASMIWVVGCLDEPGAPRARAVVAEAARILRTGGLLRIVGPAPRVPVPPATVALGLQRLPDGPAWWAGIARLLSIAGFVELRPSAWGRSLVPAVSALESAGAPGPITVSDAFR